MNPRDPIVEPLLQAYLDTALARPFDWAVHHCCHFAGAWVHAAEGLDPLADLPRVASARAAHRLVRRLGGLPAAVTARLGRAPVPGAQARLGDVVAMPMARLGGSGEALGICCGASAALGEPVSVFIADAGAAVFWPTADATHCWPLRVAAP